MEHWEAVIGDVDSSVVHLKRKYETVALCGAMGMLETGFPVSCPECPAARKVDDDKS
jgi:hypothetical protein